MSNAATNPLTYNSVITTLATLAVVGTSTVNNVVQFGDVALNNITPSLFDYAEQRICRDLDLLQTQTSNGYQLTPGNNQLTISVNDFVTIQTFNLNISGAQIPLLPTSKEFIRNVYGDPSYLDQPLYFAMHGGDAATGGATSTIILVGPYPDLNYQVLLTGTIRPPSLYQFANSTQANTGLTFISTWLPELLIQAAMVYISQYQRNFGPTANDPDMPASYEGQYRALLQGAQTEEARKRFAASGWSSMAPPVVATPGR